VHGRVEGSLTARDDIYIAEDCSGRFEVLPRGRFAGDVEAPTLVIHEGALLAGTIAMARAPEAKATHAAVHPRLARGGD
jgi:cytoskeletal protein CcmA (bactofilin family)